MPFQSNELWRLLLVDDDQEDYLIFKDLLGKAKGRNVSLEWASTYEAGEQLLDANRYDAVFADYHLGTNTGIQLIRKMAAQGYPAPMILLTGQGSYEVDLEAMDAGATFYLTKDEIRPFSLERFIRYAIERKRSEEKLREQAVQIELHHRLIAHRDQERQRIAHDLHDGAIQDLLALLMNIRFKQEMETDIKIKKEFDSIEEGLNSAVQSLRNMINEIRPPGLAHLGLSKAIRIYLENFRCNHPEIEVHTTLADKEICLPEQASLSLYRILQEAVTNAAKHSNTKRIEVTYLQNDQQTVFTIRDEGKGFFVSDSLLDYSSCGHYGLIGMKERAEAIGGQFSIMSQPDQGTTIQVVVPVSN